METRDRIRSRYANHEIEGGEIGKDSRSRRRFSRKLALPAAVFAILASGVLLGQESLASSPDHRKCAQSKQLEAGKAYSCRLKALSNATKRGVEPDYSRCDSKLRRKYERLEATVCASPRPSSPSMHRFLSTATQAVEIATEFDENGQPDWKDIPPLGTSFVDECGRSCTGRANGPHECTRVRKEVSDLTANELQRLITALRQAPSDPELMQLLQKYNDAYLLVRYDGVFLPWHRGYVLELENLLRQRDCRITIPYWDWTKTRQMGEWIHFGDKANEFSGNGNREDLCVESGPFGTDSGYELPGGRCLERRWIWDWTWLKSAEEIQSELFDRYTQPSSYDGFRRHLEGETGSGFAMQTQCRIGRTMCTTEAPHDPMFFLLYAQVDRLWSEWQSQSLAHRDAYTGSVAVGEVMPLSEWTPDEMLDLNHQPGGVRVRYE